MPEIIHISDTHVGPARDYDSRGARPLERLETLARHITGLPFAPDLVVHTGDVADDPHPEAYRLAAEVLGALDVPVCYVAGNHDNVGMMRARLPHPAGLTPLVPDPDRLAYWLDLGGVRLFALDARVPDREGPHGWLPEDQLEALRQGLTKWTGEFCVFLHYPPFPIGSRWIDAHLPLRNGGALHEILVGGGPGRNRGVFFGHLHRGLQIVRDGILYSGVSSPACQFSVGPEDATVAFNPCCPLAFNQISLSPGMTVVKEHTPSVS